MKDHLQRLVVVGTSGAGKSTFASRWSEVTGAKYVELDALFWGPNWTQTPDDEFFQKIRNELNCDRWVVAGNYTRARPLIWENATSVLWLDYAFSRVFHQVFWRTIRRCLNREAIFNGNKETFFKAFCDRDSILLWAIQSFNRTRRKYRTADLEREYPHLRFLRFTKPRQAQQMLDEAMGDVE